MPDAPLPSRPREPAPDALGLRRYAELVALALQAQ